MRAFAAVESELVKAGMAAYDDLDFQKAIELLHKALNETLTKEEKIATFKTLGFAHVATQKLAEAQKDFESLLRTDPTYQMDRTISPRVRQVFEKAQAKVASEGVGEQNGPSLPVEVTPKGPKEGTPISIKVQYPGGVASKMELFYRTRGQTKFSRMEVPSAAGVFAATVPGMQVGAPALEFYVTLIDESGAGVASAGWLGRPLVHEVIGKPKPLYTKGWFWGVLGGIAVAGAVAGVLAAVLPTHISPTTPATLTIMPQ
jgi:hypothetical protein